MKYNEEYRQRIKEYKKRFRMANRESHNAYFNEYNSKYPERLSARNAVARALKNGFLIKPDLCSKCKKKKRLVAHHEDYSKPLELIWLCYICHAKVHKCILDMI